VGLAAGAAAISLAVGADGVGVNCAPEAAVAPCEARTSATMPTMATAMAAALGIFRMSRRRDGKPAGGPPDRATPSCPFPRFRRNAFISRGIVWQAHCHFDGRGRPCH
jgi:hypothetical protein